MLDGTQHETFKKILKIYSQVHDTSRHMVTSLTISAIATLLGRTKADRPS
jgi:hypothetical protein